MAFDREQHYRDRIAALVVAYETGLANQAERVNGLEARVRELGDECANLRDRVTEFEHRGRKSPATHPQAAAEGKGTGPDA